MIQVLLGVIAMASQDGIGTFLSLAQNRDKEQLAGVLAVVSDLTTIFVTVVGAGSILKNGWSATTIATITAMMVTSYVTKRLTTKWANKLSGGTQDLTRLESRVTGLESRLAGG
jgi:Kef-type K+ transport system membrane component KefB